MADAPLGIHIILSILFGILALVTLGMLVAGRNLGPDRDYERDASRGEEKKTSPRRRQLRHVVEGTLFMFCWIGSAFLIIKVIAFVSASPPAIDVAETDLRDSYFRGMSADISARDGTIPPAQAAAILVTEAQRLPGIADRFVSLTKRPATDPDGLVGSDAEGARHFAKASLHFAISFSALSDCRRGVNATACTLGETERTTGLAEYDAGWRLTKP